MRKCSIIWCVYISLSCFPEPFEGCLLQCIYSYLLCHRLTILYCSLGSHGKNWSLVCAFLYGSILFHWSLHHFFFFWCWYHGVLITVTSLYSLKSGAWYLQLSSFLSNLLWQSRVFWGSIKKPLWVQATFVPPQRSSPPSSLQPSPSVELRCRAEGAGLGVDAQLRLSWALRVSARNLLAPQAVSVCPLCPVFGSKQACMQSSQVEARLPTAYLLALPTFQPAKWTHLPGVRPTPPGLMWPICGSKLLPPQGGSQPCNPLLFWVLSKGHFLQPWLNKSFCKFQFFSENRSTCRCIWCICGGGEFPICHLGLPRQLIFKWFGRKN